MGQKTCPVWHLWGAYFSISEPPTAEAQLWTLVVTGWVRGKCLICSSVCVQSVKGGGFCPSQFAQLDENLDENVPSAFLFTWHSLLAATKLTWPSCVSMHAMCAAGWGGGRTMRRFWLVHNQSCSMPLDAARGERDRRSIATTSLPEMHRGRIDFRECCCQSTFGCVVIGRNWSIVINSLAGFAECSIDPQRTMTMITWKLYFSVRFIASVSIRRRHDHL